MKIVIAGAGDTGNYLTQMLGNNGHDITVIDSDLKSLAEVSMMADVCTVEGNSTTFAVLRRASVRKCDLFIAINRSENDNILSAIMAKQLGAKKSIARIDNDEYLDPRNKELFISMGIDALFCPEKALADEVSNLLDHSASTTCVDCVGGRLAVVAVRIDPSSPLVGRSLDDFSAEELSKYRPIAIDHNYNDVKILASGDRIPENSMVYMIVAKSAMAEVMALSGQENVKIENVMIFGGSRIGERIASELQDHLSVKLAEYDHDKAYRLAGLLERTHIIDADIRDGEAMSEEGLQNMDAVVAVTGRSETNILTAMNAKLKGAKKVIAEVENLDYIDIAESVGVDTIINKKKAIASEIFRFTMSTDVQQTMCMTGCDADVLEFLVKPNSPATKFAIGELGLPRESILCAIVRGEKIVIASDDFRIKAYDRVVVFAKPSAISKVGKYFN